MVRAYLQATQTLTSSMSTIGPSWLAETFHFFPNTTIFTQSNFDVNTEKTATNHGTDNTLTISEIFIVNLTLALHPFEFERFIQLVLNSRPSKWNQSWFDPKYKEIAQNSFHTNALFIDSTQPYPGSSRNAFKSPTSFSGFACKLLVS